MVVRLAAMFGLFMAVVAGCRDGNGAQRVVLTGAVTHKGEPVADGTVLFVPCDGTNGPSMAVRIANGQYRADGQGGLPVGSYRVKILGYRDNPGGRQTTVPAPQLGASEHANARQQYLPDKYNVKTQLKTKIEAGARLVTRDFTLAE